MVYITSILAKTFGTLCVSGEENVDPRPPLNSVGCYKSNTFYIFFLHTLRTSTLFRWGGGKTVVKAVFMSVYRRLAINSIEKHLKKGRCPKTFWPGQLFPRFFFFFSVFVFVLQLLLLFFFCQFSLPRYLNSERLELKMRMPLPDGKTG